MTRWAFRILAMAVVLAGPLRTGASTITISLPDIGTFGGDTDTRTSDTFTGSGFLGIYPNNNSGQGGPSFVHLFGLEYYGSIYSETELQASLAGLSGATISSALLSFSLAGGSGNESVKITSFTTTGTLGFNASAPNNLGNVTGTGITGGANSIDVTPLVSAAVLAGQNWLGLYLTPQGPGNNYLFADTWVDPNTAGLKLVINYTRGNSNPVGVPETSSTAVLLGIALCLVRFGGQKLKLEIQ